MLMIVAVLIVCVVLIVMVYVSRMIREGHERRLVNRVARTINIGTSDQIHY